MISRYLGACYDIGYSGNVGFNCDYIWLIVLLLTIVSEALTYLVKYHSFRKTDFVA